MENFQQKSRTKDKYSSDYPHYFAIAPMEHSLNRASKCNATLHGYCVRFILSSYYVHGAILTVKRNLIDLSNRKTEKHIILQTFSW